MRGTGMKKRSWKVWLDRRAGAFGQFVTPVEVQGIVDAAPGSLRVAPLHQDAIRIGAYMREWLDDFTAGKDIDRPTPPWIENDIGEDPRIEYSKMIGFLHPDLAKPKPSPNPDAKESPTLYAYMIDIIHVL